MKQNKTAHWLRRGIALGTAFLLGSALTLAGVCLGQRIVGTPVSKEVLRKLSEVEELVDAHYLFDIDAEEAANSTAAGYASVLDQYSIYRDPTQYEAFQDKNEGEMCGIGVTVVQYDPDALTVLFLTDDSPAAGLLLPGDEIIAVEGETVESLGYAAAVSKVKGEEGSYVSLTVRRDEQERTVSVQRQDIVNTGIYSMCFEGVGYVRISTFNNATPDAFATAVTELIGDGVDSLLFDVRNNGGGLLNSVTAMLDFLLPSGDLVSKTDKDGRTTVLYTSDESCIDLPMAVLVNESTASAAELFACDLQEYGVATVVGTQTFGKGVMQTTYPLSDGSSLTLTTDYYNPSSGQNYNGTGVIPDVVRELTDEERADYVHFDPDHDPQLAAALDVLRQEDTDK